MAAECLGALSCGYARNVLPAKNEIVWVTRSYNPKEPRRTSMVPVPRHKFTYPSPEKLPDVPAQWRLQVEPPIYSYSRWSEEKYHYPSSPATRCEQWSTLRQSLPSKERFLTQPPGTWGTGQPTQKDQPDRKQSSRYSHTNSSMTRYVDEMHLTNRLFKLH